MQAVNPAVASLEGVLMDETPIDPSNPSFALALLRIRQYAQSLHEGLRPDDPRLAGTGVRLAHRDGTRMRLESAFLETPGDWVCVFTRDHGFFVYHRSQLAGYSQHQRHRPRPAATA